MILTTDHTSHIGEQHLRTGKPNQDYALSGVFKNDAAYAIVSDGCSSGGMTDIGARLMAVATLRSLEEGASLNMYFDIENSMSRDAYLESFRTTLKLETKDLLATSLWAVVNERGAAVDVAGDGVVAMKYEQALVVSSLEWNKNQPYYPAYRLGSLNQQFIMSHTTSREPYQLTQEVVCTESGSVTTTISQFEIEYGMRGLRLFGHLDHPEYGRLQTVALFSDGVEQVDQFDRLSVVQALLALKSTKGQFAVRRMNRFLKDTAGTSKGPVDDISCAVIKLDQTET